MRDNFKPHEVKREHGVEWTGDARQRDWAAYTCRDSAKYHPEYEKGRESPVLRSSIHHLSGFIPLLYVKVTVFFFSNEKKNKDAVLLEVKADGLQGAKLPRTLSTRRCQAEGPSYVFTVTLSTSVQPPLP